MKTQLKTRIDELSSKAWNAAGDEQNARLHELIMLYDELLPLEDDPYYIFDGKARIHQHLKEYDHAVDCVKSLLSLNNESAHYWWLMANIQFEAGDYANALIAMDHCIQYDFVADWRHELRAKINTALGNLEEAKKDQRIFDDYQAREQAKWDDPNHYYHYK